MRYRKLDDSGDMVFGGGQSAFYRDQPEAVAQAVKTRLAMRLGEWFLDTTAGTPWDTKILGKFTAATRDATIRARIMGTTGVVSIETYSSTFDPDSRSFAAAATISTAYGKTKISEPI